MTSTENPYAGQGPVLLDVGGDVGALLVTTPASMEGVEIEIRSRQPGLQVDPDDPGEVHDHGQDSHLHGHDRAPDQNGATSHVTHVQVLTRPTPVGLVTCAVFPSLFQGGYELYERPSGPVRLQVTITGGQVTETSWPSPDTGG
jgi:hypothetical protein